MKFFAAIIITFAMTSALFAQEEEQEFVTETSCSLSIKTSVYPVDSSDKFGKVAVEALLTDNKGNPLPDQQIRIIATNGVFTCMPPVSFSEAEPPSNVDECLRTQEDGTVKIYLVRIPFNRPGNVKAFCSYGKFKVSSVGAYSIKKFSKSTATKKARPPVNPKKKIPMSGDL